MKRHNCKKNNLRFYSLMFVLSLFICSISPNLAWSAVYYVDATAGNDNNVGTDQAWPWKTLNKINVKINSDQPFLPGDEILLKCGQTWSGSLKVTCSGAENNPIKIGSYGSGQKPLIKGSKKLTLANFISHAQNAWKVSVEKEPVPILYWNKVNNTSDIWCVVYPSKPVALKFKKDINADAVIGKENTTGWQTLKEEYEWCWVDAYSVLVVYCKGNPEFMYSAVFADTQAPSIYNIWFEKDNVSILGNRKDSVDLLSKEYDWVFDGQYVYVYASSIPSSCYSAIEIPLQEYVIALQAADYVKVENIEAKYCGVSTGVAMMAYNTNGATFDNLTVSYCAGYSGILLTTDSELKGKNNAIQNCLIHDITGTPVTLLDSNYGDGIVCNGTRGQNYLQHNLVYKNTVYNVGASGIGLGYASNNNLSSNTVYKSSDCGMGIYGETSADNIIEYNIVYENCQKVDDRAGINLFRVGNNNIVRYNKVYAQHDTYNDINIPINAGYSQKYGAHGIRFDAGDQVWGGPSYIESTGNMIYYNQIYNEYIGIVIFNASNVAIYNNTIYNSAKNGISAGASNSDNLPLAGLVVKNNIIYLAGEKPISEYNTQSSDISNNLLTDPLFVDASKFDFHILSNSPARNVGLNVGLTRDIDGKEILQNEAPDVGAYEYADVLPAAPTAKFSSDVQQGAAPLSVNFVSESTGAIDSYNWNFGDMTTSSQQNPSHTFLQAGKYTVSLIAAGPGGSTVDIKQDYITVVAANTAPVIDSVTAAPSSGTVPLAVNFVALAGDTEGAITYNWDFGDGSSATGATASHIYNTAGSYVATLTVTDEQGLTVLASETIAAQEAVVLPAAPSNLVASALSRSRINLTWADNSGNETGFKIERATSSTGIIRQIATVDANVTSYTNSGLSRNRTYYYRVRAYNTNGDSAYSNTASAATPRR